MIHVENVSKTYSGGVAALHATSLRFERARFVVLLGSSGAGKSTLLRCLNMLTVPTTGTVSVTELGTLTSAALMRKHRRHTGMIFQQHQLIAHYTALRNVLLGRVGYHGSLRTLLPLPRAERCIALQCLERVGLLDKALERVDRLSGGQQQRVGIARALAQRPKLVLADEPVASLDPATARRVLAMLKSICCEDGITAVVSLHQLELAREYADRVVGLSHGRVVFDDVPAQLDAAAISAIYDSTVRPPSSAMNATIEPPFELATLET